jgi:hypothetical protein
LLVLPLLLLVGIGWAGYTFVAQPPIDATVPVAPPPQLTVSEARVVNPQEISIEAQTQDVPNGTTVNARVLEDGEPIAWIESTAASGAVTDNAIVMRIRKARDWTQTLSKDATYSVELTISSEPPVTASQALDVPAPLAESFFGVALAPTVQPTAQPEPTTQPEVAVQPEPTPPSAEPTAAPSIGIPTLIVGANATLLVSPTLGSGLIATATSGASYQPLLRTPDGKFFLVHQGNRVGWLPASQATIDSAQVSQIALTTPSDEAVQAGPLRANVGNGGNIRYGPSVKTGTVLGQLHYGQTVTVKARTADGVWYQVVAPEAEGWVHVSLLRMEPGVMDQVPRAN